MSDLLEATREKARVCRNNGNDIAAAEYESYAERIAELEGQVSVGIETHVEDRKRIAELEAKLGRVRGDLLAVAHAYDDNELRPAIRSIANEYG